MRRPACVSLFSGAGGLDLGLEMAGWSTVYASDKDRDAVATLKSNLGLPLDHGHGAFGDAFIEQADVKALTGQDVLDRSGLRRGDAALLAGGPPCQSWSSAGHQLGFSDPRGRLFDDFVRIANQIDARWLLMENVRGLLTARGPDGQPGSALVHIRRTLLQAGFQTTVSLLNAADFGVPQRRVRLFIAGFRVGDPPRFPKPTHAKPPGPAGAPEWVPLSHALATISDLSDDEVIRPTGKLAVDLESIPPGSGVKSPGKAERTRPGGHWGYKQGAFVADPRLPARTVTAGAQQDWVRDPVRGLRRVCPRECAAIQAFPPEWRFEGNLASQYRQIGNAVPPLLAAAIGACLMAGDLGNSAAAGIPDMHDILPLPPHLASHVAYTQREEASNGPSRRLGPKRRPARLPLLDRGAVWP